MSYRSLLVCLDDPAGAQSTLQAASQIAADHNAHLTAVYVVPPLGEYTALDLPVPQAAVDGFLKMHRKRAAEIEEIFRQQTTGQSFAAEWRFLDTCVHAVDDTVAAMANAFDLLVIGGSNEVRSPGRRNVVSEKVLLSCARPVLIVPTNLPAPESFKRVLVAYDQGMQSSRAIFNAMPILQRADSVTLQRINPQAGEQAYILDQADEILSTLARHDVVAELVYSNAREGLFHHDEIGRELLDIASDNSADVLVMGAYSHHRLGQQVLGGTTRTILDDMNLPVLLSH